ncbi:hypothetical protein M3Y96_00700400 [Aphelenchoides besseyi]|nr:hypothetical protein M3Y96_00700400 [Aphelenchoides besseyi]
MPSDRPLFNSCRLLHMLTISALVFSLSAQPRRIIIPFSSIINVKNTFLQSGLKTDDLNDLFHRILLRRRRSEATEGEEDPDEKPRPLRFGRR